MNIESPSYETLEKILRSSAGHVIIAAPFISRSGLQFAEKALASHEWRGIDKLEIWVSLSIEAHLAQVMDFSALLDFVKIARALQPPVEIEMFEDIHLHAKVFRSRHGALITSANLSDRAFNSNVEIAVFLRPGSELKAVDRWLHVTRKSRMKPLSYSRFEEFVSALPKLKPAAPILEGEAEVALRGVVPPHLRFPLR